MENPTVLHIKALSFLLYNLQSQLDLPTQFHHESKELTASSAVATLLTREKGGVAVMGTGISSAGVQISATESIESTDESANDAESGSRLEVALAINSKKNSPRKLVVTAFDLSLISPFNLEALVSKKDTKTDLESHAAEILGALKELSSPEFKEKTRRADHIRELKQFSVARSFRKICSRFDAGNQVVTPTKNDKPVGPSQTAASNFIKVLEGIQFNSGRALVLDSDSFKEDGINISPPATATLGSNTILLFELPQTIAAIFAREFVPSRANGTTTMFELAIHTLPAWNAALVAMLKRVKKLLSDIVNNPVYNAVSAKTFRALTNFLSALNLLTRAPAFIAFLNQSDVKDSLWKASELKLKRDHESAEARRKEWLKVENSVEGSLGRDLSMSSNLSDGPDTSHSTDSDDSADLRITQNEVKYDQFLHWMRNFTAWGRAVDILASQPVLFSTIPVRVNIVKLPVPDKRMTPLKTIVHDALSRLTAVTEEDKSRLISYVKRVTCENFNARSGSGGKHTSWDKVLELYWENGGGFTGAVHCETTLCALRYASEKSELESFGAELSPETRADEVERVFKRFSSCVGVANKHCWCRSRLATALATDLQDDKSFISKGAHNVILLTRLLPVPVIPICRQSTPESVPDEVEYLSKMTKWLTMKWMK